MTRDVSYTDFRNNPTKYLDKVRDGGPIHIKRDAGSVVIMSEEQFEGWMETLYLLRSSANAKELMGSIAELDAGKGVEGELIEP
jgi:antitoxin YefM